LVVSIQDRDTLVALRQIVEGVAARVIPEQLIAVSLGKYRLSTRAEWCSLFLVYESCDRLSIAQQKVIMLPDAYQSYVFDPRADRKTGFKTSSCP
jgi:hypothetical protein